MTSEAHTDLKKIPYDSIVEAQLLLEFATQRGLTVETTIVNTLVQAKHLAASNQWTEQVEVEFWQAFDAIARLVKPVDIASLKATSTTVSEGPSLLRKILKRPKISRSEKAINFFSILSAFFLCLLLLFQITWSYGTSVVNSIKQVSEEITGLTEQISAKQIAKGDKAADDPEIATLKAKQEVYQNRYNAGYLALWKWRAYVGLDIADLRKSSSEISSDILKKNIKQQQMDFQTNFQDARFTLEVMQLYLLPLLYGFLGACAYVLRTLTDEIKNVTYTPSSNIRYLVRIQLGGLSGLAIGWFTKPETASPLLTASPFALAFVAGYCVELFFSLIDRVIAAFKTDGVVKKG